MKLSEFKQKLPGESQLNELNSRVQGLMLVLDLVKQMNMKISRRDILKTIIQYAMKISNCSRGAILITENDDLEFKIGLNINNDSVSENEFNISYSVCNDVLKTGSSMFIEEAQGKNYQPTVSIVSLNLHTIFCSPLTFDGSVFGVLYVDSTSLSTNNMDAINEFFEIFADHAAITIKNANQINP